MTTSAAPEKVSTPYTLQSPPPGASFEFAEVKTDRGQISLGKVPILTWDESEEGFQGMLAFYGPAGIAQIANGTSIKVVVQGIARRLKPKGKSDEEIAKEQLEYRPGTRQGGASTPASRLAAHAKKAAEKFNADGLAQLISRLEDPAFRAQVEAMGIDLSTLPQQNGGDEGDDNEDEGEDQQ